MKVLLKFLSVAIVTTLVPALASGATTILSDNLDANTGWTINADVTASASFGYDYSADGIPEAPNTVGGAAVGGTATTGLKADANTGTGAGEAVAVVRDLAALGHAAGDDYKIQMDIWGNWEGGSGSATEFMGLSVGRDATSSSVNGASFLYTGDGGSSRDYRLYKDFDEQRTTSADPVEGPQYLSVDNATQNGNNGGLEPFSSFLPSVDIATVTGGLQVGNTGATDNGDGGFTWLTVEATVRPLEAGAAGTTADLGTAEIRITNHLQNRTIRVGILDNSNGDSLLGSFEGNVGLLYADFFSSLNASGFNFGIFDNIVIVTNVPEPTSMMLFGLGAIGLFSTGRRRR